MHILFYHWAPFYDPRKESGGIAVYMSNLISYLCNHTAHQITCLFSGYRGNSLRNAPYLKRTHNPYEQLGCRTWEIINSPVTSPLFYNAYNPHLACDDNATSELFLELVQRAGGFDVIHFHSLEGITPQVLVKLKKRYPGTRLIFSVHDYHPLCPLVRLFQTAKCRHCTDYCEGEACLHCVPTPPKTAYRTPLERYLSDPYNKPFWGKLLLKNPFRNIFTKRLWQSVTQKAPSAKDFAHYRATYIQLLNQCVDHVLPVSKRTGQLMANYGIRPELMNTCYIGTKAAEQALNKQRNQPTDNIFTIAFLGYAWAEEKGFPFLVQALKRLPKETASRIRFVVAAKGADKPQLEQLLNHMAGITLLDGYTHDQLPEILSHVHLGIVPVLWEDNLPQVAIEMVANGIPILCSDMGGASELSSCEDFKFKAGNKANFIEKLTNILKHPELLQKYWDNHTGLTTMEQHVKQLEIIYRKDKA